MTFADVLLAGHLTAVAADTLLFSVKVGHLGGALARPAPGGGAQPSIDANYLLTAIGAAPTPDLAAAAHAQAQTVKDALAPWHAGYVVPSGGIAAAGGFPVLSVLPGQFLLKDLVLIGASLWTLGDSVGATSHWRGAHGGGQRR